MKSFIAALLVFILISSVALVDVRSQIVAPPFDTWYGFNTNNGGHEYFLNSGRLADIDNDNDLDFLGSRYFAGFMGSATGFVVLRNNGDGFFNSVPVIYPTSVSSEFVFSARLNNDSFEDVIVSNTGNNFSGNTITVFFNQGNGTFLTSANYVIGGGPVGIATGDFNGDAKQDIAVASYGSFGSGNSVAILINNGDGTFANAVSYPAGNSPFKIVSGKINSDNFLDIAVANMDGKVNILLNSGTGDFSNRTEYSFELSGSANYTSVSLADVDHDNDNDIFYCNRGLNFMGTSAIGILKNNNGVFTDPVLIPSDWMAASFQNIDVADLNGDGWVDIAGACALARTADGYQVILNNGSGGFLPAYKNPAGQNTQDLILGDVDNDGKTDIVTTDSYSMMATVHKNPGNGIFFVPNTFETGISIAGSVDAADIDGDNDLDLILSASGRAAVGVPVRIMKNLGNGNFGEAFTHSIRGGGVQGKFRDLNGDNKPDILFATAINSPPYDFHYAINNGDGTFGAVQTKSIGSAGWYDIDAADLDNDGDNDVIVTEWLGTPPVPTSGRRIFICLNSGNASFGSPIIKLAGTHTAPIGIGDFNNDGNKDIATGSSGALINISLGMGNGDFQESTSYSIGEQGGATDIEVMDFNNDGNADIASSNFFENTWMSVLYGNGDGTFQPAVTLPSAYSPDLLNVSGITSGDLDGDGDRDIIVGNNASNSLSLYYNNNGSFEYKMRAGAYSGVSAPLFADFDNDNKGDIVGTGMIPPSGIGSNIIFMKGKNTGTTGVSGNSIANIPKDFLLSQNYPNPFNPATKISFEIPASEKVTIKVYDATGRVVDVLLNEFKNEGRYEVSFNGSNLSSGVYFYSLISENFKATKKMVLLK
ncbi:MAG: T9SS type A sorting domain-containing protein [Ignavibacteria bacterium]